VPLVVTAIAAAVRVKPAEHVRARTSINYFSCRPVVATMLDTKTVDNPLWPDEVADVIPPAAA
jgi:hypothetical protein